MALVKYNKANVYKCCDVLLIPGVNEIEDGNLVAVLDHPLFQHRIDNGIIEIIDGPKRAEKDSEGQKPQEAPKRKRGRPPKNKSSGDDKLIQLMPKIYDVKLLKKYISSSQNAAVVAAAEKQLEVMENVPVNEEKDGITVE